MTEDLYYSLVLFLSNYVELIYTYPSLQTCLDASVLLGDGACIEVSLLETLR
jgi:hypothetical protein